MNKTELSNRLIYLADLLESLGDSEDRQLVKEVKAEYKSISDQLYPPTKEFELPQSKIKESRVKALLQIKDLLKAANIEEEAEGKRDGHKFIAWLGNVNGMPREFTIECVDPLYKAMTGYKIITASRSLFSEKQLKGYRSFERALLETGLKLCSGRKDKKEFFEQYVVKYNEKLKANEQTTK